MTYSLQKKHKFIWCTRALLAYFIHFSFFKRELMVVDGVMPPTSETQHWNPWQVLLQRMNLWWLNEKLSGKNRRESGQSKLGKKKILSYISSAQAVSRLCPSSSVEAPLKHSFSLKNNDTNLEKVFSLAKEWKKFFEKFDQILMTATFTRYSITSIKWFLCPEDEISGCLLLQKNYTFSIPCTLWVLCLLI